MHTLGLYFILGMVMPSGAKVELSPEACNDFSGDSTAVANGLLQSQQSVLREGPEEDSEPVETLGSADAAKAKAYVEHLLIIHEGDGTKLSSADAWPLPAGVESMTCTWGLCNVSRPATGEIRQRIMTVLETGKQLNPTSDKVGSHSYQTMYGMHLMPLMRAKSNAKIFEIGLGCDMFYGPGASVSLWKTLFPEVDLWEAEYNTECVNRSQAAGLLAGINVVTGDQGDPAVLQGWIEKSEGKFDAVIDDGGHKNQQIRTSFEALWPHVTPGGLYFMEDLQVGRVSLFTDGGVVTSDMVQAWVGQLLTGNAGDAALPEGVESIFCQAEACMLKKASQGGTAG